MDIAEPLAPLTPKTIKKNIDVLKRFFILQHLTERSLEKLSHSIEERTYKRGYYLFKEGDLVDGIYLVIEGEFFKSKVVSPEKPQSKCKSCPFIVKEELPYSKIGEFEIIGLRDIFGSQKRDMSVRCNSPTSLVYFIRSKEVVSRLRDERTLKKVHALLKQQTEFFSSRVGQLREHFDIIKNIHQTWAGDMDSAKINYK